MRDRAPGQDAGRRIEDLLRNVVIERGRDYRADAALAETPGARPAVGTSVNLVDWEPKSHCTRISCLGAGLQGMIACGLYVAEAPF